MVTLPEFKALALSLPEVEEAPHFDKTSFRIKKKIFATLNIPEERATLKFTPEEQEMFCKINPDSIYQVPNKWGKQGWTHLLYLKLESEVVDGLLKAAYCTVAPKNLAEKIV